MTAFCALSLQSLTAFCAAAGHATRIPDTRPEYMFGHVLPPLWEPQWAVIEEGENLERNLARPLRRNHSPFCHSAPNQNAEATLVRREGIRHQAPVQEGFKSFTFGGRCGERQRSERSSCHPQS
jgi:hypothetical protein